jgi:predicted nucleotidyltransferase
MLEGLISSKTKRKVLNLLFSNPDTRFYTRQLEKGLKEPVGAIRRELIKLERYGILSSEREANIKYYRVNKNCPIYPEIKRIILKTTAIGEHLKRLIENVPEVKYAFIYGSFASDEEAKDSDIDLMVIGDIDSVDLHTRVSEIEQEIGRNISYTLMSLEEFHRKERERDGLLGRIVKGKKIMLKGKEDEL